MLKTRFAKAVACCALAASLTISAVGLAVAADYGTASSNQKVDYSTLHDWERYFGKSVTDTDHVGGIWTDKTVLGDAADGGSAGKLTTEVFKDEIAATEKLDPVIVGDNNFLITLSALGSTKSVSGQESAPLDLMLVLDLSSSMYDGSTRSTETVEAMVESVNSTIDELMDLNPDNRAGVVIYFGRENLAQSDASHGKLLLPLGHYAPASGEVIETVISGGKLQGVRVCSGVAAANTHSVKDVAGTYIQLGIQLATQELTKATTTTSDGKARLPIMVLMSDGAPTAATTSYSNVGVAEMGNNQVASRCPAETDFLTQLTAAYSKKLVSEHYSKTPLLYTLGFNAGGVKEVSLDVMDPGYATSDPAEKAISDQIENYWKSLIAKPSTAAPFYITAAEVSTGEWTIGGAKTFDVYKAETPKGALFPSNLSQQDYVDKYYQATDAASLKERFNDILAEIELQAAYKPTLVDDSLGDNLSGYVEIYDNLSEFMEVKSVYGILSDGVLHTGKHFCSHLSDGGFGTVSDPTELGDAFIKAVSTRLGVTTAQARDLVSEAYAAGQLAYSTSGYSNYIGWWAKEGMVFGGFWDGVNLPSSADARYVVKSYGMLGESSDGLDGASMLYSYVDVYLDIHGEKKGETEVVWGVPASLLPLVKYSVTISSEMAEGKDASVSITEENPIRLLYEVGLRDEYANPDTIVAKMNGKTDGTAFRVESDGRYTFFTNKWEQTSATDETPPHAGSNPVIHVNTTAYFEPSRENERYYYTDDATVYKLDGTSYVPYKGATKPAGGDFYRAHYMFDWSASGNPASAKVAIHYAKIEASNLDHAQCDDSTPTSNSTWHIPKGTILRTVDQHMRDKTSGTDLVYDKAVDNPTGTLRYSNYPSVGTKKIDSVDHLYAVDTLGNNGTISLMPSTGIVLTKKVDVPAAPGTKFEFTITALNSTNATVASLNKTFGNVKFTNGEGTVSFEAGGSVSIVGDLAGAGVAKLKIVETNPTTHYEFNKFIVATNGVAGSPIATNEVVVSVPKTGTLIQVECENALKTEGDIILTKKVVDSEGKEILPENDFEFVVNIKYGDASKMPASYNSSKGSITSFAVHSPDTHELKVSLSAGEILTIYGIDTSAHVTVWESDSGSLVLSEDKTKQYTSELGSTSIWDAANKTLEGDVTTSNLKFGFVNQYAPDPVSAAILVEGEKNLIGRSWTNDDYSKFEFELQQLSGTTWTSVGSVAATSERIVDGKNVNGFDLSSQMQSLSFSKVGDYWFRVVEVLPGGINDGVSEKTEDGVTYYSDEHIFVVSVRDEVNSEGELTGKLTIDGVSTVVGGGDVSEEGHVTITGNSSGSDYKVYTHFTNTYKATGSTTLEIDMLKTVINQSGDSALDSPVGYTFGLYEKGGTLLSTVDVTSADGKVTGSWTHSYLKDLQHGRDDTGVHEYYIKEIIPAVPVPGMSYDSTEHWFTVTVEDNGYGELIIYSCECTDPCTCKKDDNDDDKLENHEIAWKLASDNGASEIEFVNSIIPYIPSAKANVMISATKTLDGEACSDGKFTFELKDDKGNVVATASNGAGGAVSFGSLSFDKAGTYKYSISEKVGSDKKIEYDGSVYEVVITATEDASGNLSATTSVTKDGAAYDGVIAFANKTVGPEPDPNPDPKPGDKPSDLPAISPTGDNSGLWVILGIACVSAAALLLALRMLKRRA